MDSVFPESADNKPEPVTQMSALVCSQSPYFPTNLIGVVALKPSDNTP